MLNCPYILCLEDAWNPSPCLRPVSWQRFACFKGCNSLTLPNYETGASVDNDNLHKGYNQNMYFGSTLFINTLRRMITYEIAYDKVNEDDNYDAWAPWWYVTNEEIEDKMEKFATVYDFNRPFFLVNEELVLLRNIRFQLRSDFFYCFPKYFDVKYSNGKARRLSSGAGTIGADWHRAVIPKSIELPECEGFDIIECKTWLHNTDGGDRPTTNAIFYGNTIPDGLIASNGFIDSEYFVACMVKIVPKDTSWCGPLIS